MATFYSKTLKREVYVHYDDTTECVSEAAREISGHCDASEAQVAAVFYTNEQFDLDVKDMLTKAQWVADDLRALRKAFDEVEAWKKAQKEKRA